MLMMKRTFLALACAAMMLPAAANWTPGDNSLTNIAQQTSLEFNSPAMIRKADGSTILVYRSYGIQTNPETGEKSAKRMFYLYLQILDKDGNKKFDGNGKLISYKPTDAAAYGSPNLDTLSNGNIIITFADIRNVANDNYTEINDDVNHTNVKACKIIAYCYDQEGNSVWSPDGVMMPYHVMDPESNCTFYAGEKLVVSGDKIYLAAAILEQYTSTDPHTFDPVDNYAHYFEVACLDYSGNVLAEKHYETWQAFNFKIAPGPEGKCYYVYVDETDHYSAQLLGPDCENTWPESKFVEPYPVVSRDSNTAVAFPPSEMFELSDGSVGLVYKAFMPNHFSQCYYNRIYPDGSVLPEHVLLSDTAGADHSHAIMLSGDTLTLAECVQYPRADYGEYFLSINRILLDGTRLCPRYDGYWADVNRGVDPKPLCIVKADENYNVIVFVKDYGIGTFQAYSYTISPEGKLFQRKRILKGVFIDDIVNVSEDNYAYLIFGRDQNGKKGIWISCIDGTDYTNSTPLTGELPGKFSVSANKQVQFSKANLQYLPVRQTYFFGAHQMFAQTELNRWISETCLDFEDLFGWGTGNNPIKTSLDDMEYPSFKEWGNNAILNSTYEPGTWRTMSQAEWNYLLNGRANAAQKRAVGQITMDQRAPFIGMFLLPDTFEMPQGLEMDMEAQEWDVNAYDGETLLRLEEAGVVFLPAGGFRTGLNIHDIDIGGTNRADHGYYWTTTDYELYDAQMVYIDKVGPSFQVRPRSNGMLVRLVRDTEADPEGIDNISQEPRANSQKLIINGQLFIERNGRIYDAQGKLVD